MSIAGPDEVVLRLHHPLAARAPDHQLRVERNQRRRRVRRIHRHAAVLLEDRVLAVDRRRRVRVADVAARPVARPAAAVIPAARVLRDVAAERPLVADLRRGHQFGRFHQQPELLLHHRVVHHLGQRRRRADLEAAVHLLDPAQLGDLAQVDHHARALGAVLQPVERIEPAAPSPRLPTRAASSSATASSIARRLEQLERRHHVANYCHIVLLEFGHLVIWSSGRGR